MSSFKELVDGYNSSVASAIILTSKYGEDIPMHGKVLLHKVEKHAALCNYRSMAMYVALFLADYSREDIPSGVVAACKAANLKRNGRQVGYPHADGTYHWFGDK
jgi:hypothetical protein